MSHGLWWWSVSVFVLAGMACASAQVPQWQQQLDAGMSAFKSGRYTEARTLLQSAYDGTRAPGSGADGTWRARAAYELGSLARTQGDCAASERFQVEARTILETEGGNAALLAMVWNGLGEALLEQGRFDESEKWFALAVPAFERDPAMKNGAYLGRRHLAEIRIMRQDFNGAEQALMTLIVNERREASAPDLPGALGDLGRLYMMDHRWKDAESLLREAMDRDLKLGEHNPALADSQTALATLYRVEGRIERAEPLLRKALKTYEISGDPHAAAVYAQLGWCALAEHKDMTAREFLDKAVDVAAAASMPEGYVSRLRAEAAAVEPAYAESVRPRR